MKRVGERRREAERGWERGGEPRREATGSGETKKEKKKNEKEEEEEEARGVSGPERAWWGLLTVGARGPGRDPDAASVVRTKLCVGCIAFLCVTFLFLFFGSPIVASCDVRWIITNTDYHSGELILTVQCPVLSLNSGCAFSFSWTRRF